MKKMKRYKEFVNEDITKFMTPKSDDHILKKLEGLDTLDKVITINKYNIPKEHLPNEEDIEKALNIKFTHNSQKELKIIFIIKNQLDFKFLPEGDLHISGTLHLSYKNIKKIPDNLTVDDDLWCDGNPLTELPKNLTILGDFDCSECEISEIPLSLKTNGDLNCGRNKIKKLPKDLVVNGNLFCDGNQLTELPENIKLNGGLWCYDNNLTHLPDNLTITDNLNCTNNQLTELPKGLVVNGNVWCGGNKNILEKPSDAKISGNFKN